MSTPDLIIFGGTFDPPHQAHVDLVRAALARFPEARLLVLPAPQPAGAGGVHKAPTAAYAARLAMSRAAFAPLAARVAVEALEAELPAPHYTVATLAEVKRRWPSAQLGFLMGQDSLETLPRWREPKQVLTMASLIVAPRTVVRQPPTAAATDDATAFLALRRAAETVFAALGLNAAWQEATAAFLSQSTGDVLYLLPRPVGDVASHLTRAALARGDALPDGWLPPAVAHHIRIHHLYGA